jgi:alanine racemase
VNITGFSPYLEISLDNLLFNLRQIRTCLKKGIDILAVVKDCSYGCGSRLIAHTLEHQGKVAFFAVARAQEAFVLRQEEIKSPILVLGRATDEQLAEGWRKGIVFTLTDLEDFDRWENSGCKVRFHLLIDTGMNRMGILPSEIDRLADRLLYTENLQIEGAFTHLANADEVDTPTVTHQLAIFRKSLEKLKTRGFEPAHVHYGNSATIMRYPPEGCTMVRPGISLYGCKPDPAQDFPVSLKPVVSLKSSVIKVKKVPPGTPVSYGGKYVTKQDTFIATIALGYAHGFPRFLSNKGEVLIRGKRYKIAGNVTMDYIMVDAGSSTDITVGDEVVAIGYQEEECISPDDIALIGNTIGYEILCNLGTSIDRFYISNGSEVFHEKGFIF